jgi:hypothetical protein
VETSFDVSPINSRRESVDVDADTPDAPAAVVAAAAVTSPAESLVVSTSPAASEVRCLWTVGCLCRLPELRDSPLLTCALRRRVMPDAACPPSCLRRSTTPPS